MANPLPQKAAELLQDQTVDLRGLSREEMQQLIHQLQRRQAELMSENESLRRTQSVLQAAPQDLKRWPEEDALTGQKEQPAGEIAFRALVDYPLQGMVILKDDRLIFINRMLTEMLGYRAEELLGMTFEELSRRTIHPDDRHWVFQRLRDRLEGQPAPARYELRVIRKDGTIRWLEQFVGHITYDGEPALQVVSIDITKRKQMEETLRKSEEKSRSVIEQSSDGIVLTDDQGRIIEMNRSYERITGLVRAEILGQFFWDVQFKLVPDEFKTPEIYRKTRAQILHFLETGQADWMNRLLERRIRRPNGTVRHVQSTVFPVRREDKIVMIGGIIRDVSEQKQAEEARRRSEARYRLLVGNAPLGIVSIDQAGNIVDINDKFLELLGSPSPEFTRSVNVLTFPPIVKAGISDDFRRCLESGDLVVKERWYRSHWGKAIYLRYHLAALRDAQDQIIGVQGLVEDVTQRKQTEETLHRYAKRLQALHQIDREILAAQSPETIATAALRHILELVSCTQASIVELDPQAEAVRILATCEREGCRDKLETPVLESILQNKELEKGQTQLVQNILALPRLGPAEQALLVQGIRSYLNVPMIVQEELMGLLHLAATEPDVFTPDAIEIATEVANLLAVALRQARLHVQTRQDARTKADLLAEVNHRVSNNLAGLIGLLSVEKRYARRREEPAVEAALARLAGRVEGLATVHRLLSQSQWRPVVLSKLAAQIIEAALSALPPDRRIRIEVKSSPAVVSPKQASHLALILNELAINTIKHSRQQVGRIMVEIETEKDWIELTYQDDGPGYSERVLSGEGHSVGLYLLEQLASTLSGQLRLDSDNGAVTRLRFPIARGRGAEANKSGQEAMRSETHS